MLLALSDDHCVFSHNSHRVVSASDRSCQEISIGERLSAEHMAGSLAALPSYGQSLLLKEMSKLPIPLIHRCARVCDFCTTYVVAPSR